MTYAISTCRDCGLPRTEGERQHCADGLCASCEITRHELAALAAGCDPYTTEAPREPGWPVTWEPEPERVPPPRPSPMASIRPAEGSGCGYYVAALIVAVAVLVWRWM